MTTTCGCGRALQLTVNVHRGRCGVCRSLKRVVRRTPQKPRPRITCPCRRRDMDYKALRCDDCKAERRRRYFAGYYETVKKPEVPTKPRVSDIPVAMIDAIIERHHILAHRPSQRWKLYRAA